MGTVVAGLMVVSLSVCAALAGYLAVQRRWAAALRKQHNDVAGFIYAVIGIAYGVLLAYVVVVVWQEVSAAQLTAEQEANAVADLYLLGSELPAPSGPLVRELARAYVKSVIEDEWPQLAQGRASARTTELAMALGRAVRATAPQTAREQVLFDHALSVHQSLQDSRRLRLFQSRLVLQPILWVVLITGGVLTVAFTYLFGLASTRAHALMIAAVAATIAGILFMIQVTDDPYAGDARVRPTPFELVQALIDGP